MDGADVEDQKTNTGYRRKYVRTLIVLSIVYLGAYIILSLAGGYRAAASGRVRLPYGFAFQDTYEWQPRFGHLNRRTRIDGTRDWEGDLIGFVFFPLICLDHGFWHRPHNFMRNDGSIIHDELPSGHYLHPSEQRNSG